MADKAPPDTTTQLNTSGEAAAQSADSEDSRPVFPAKMRVHALAKLLGQTSKQLLSTLKDQGHELRSAHSTVERDVAERVWDSVHLPSSTADDLTSAAAPRVDAPAPEPSLFSAVAGTAAPESVRDDVAVDVGPPLFLPPPEIDAEEEARKARKRTRKPRRDADDGGSASDAQKPDAQKPDAQKPDVQKSDAQKSEPKKPDAKSKAADADADAATTKAEKPGVDDGDYQDDDGDGSDDNKRNRRRRRGRRGRGRGKGDAGSPESGGSDDSGSESDAGKGDAGKGDAGKGDAGKGDTADASQDSDNAGSKAADADSTRSQQSDRDGKADDSTDADADTSASTDNDDDSDNDDQSSSSTRRRRRRRRRKGGSDDADSQAVVDDPPNTVVHEREPRNKARKDEVQGISGSTRLEAKRQRRRDGRDTVRRRPPILTEAEFLARREAVERVMVVREKRANNQSGTTTQIGVLEDGMLVEHFVTSASSGSIVGNIYLGRVQNVLPSMEAAFVDIGRGRNGVLYAGEVNWDAAGLGGSSRKIEQALKSGDQILVQVSKDPVGHKGARLTTQISLAGRFLVYVPDGSSTGISRKLPENERKRLKDILRDIVPDDAGVIIRTASEGVAADELSRDVDRLQKLWASISEQVASEKGNAPKSLYEEPDLLVKVVRDLFNEDFASLVVQGDRVWNTVEGYVRKVAPDLVDRVRKHEGNTDVFAHYRIDEQIAKALDRKVWLPSGGTLVIDRTEAMTVIDVNTGKFTGSGGNLEETVTRNNLEAAEEIVRQLRLRDVGGMVVIDFIDMVLEQNRDLILRRLTEALARDRTRHQVSEVTSLGLVQMTRKRIGTGLIEAFSTCCDHCHGRGLIMHDEPVETQPEPDRGAGGSRRPRRAKVRVEPEPEVSEEVATEIAPPAVPVEELKAQAEIHAKHPMILAMTTQGADEGEVPAQAAEAPETPASAETPAVPDAVEVAETATVPDVAEVSKAAEPAEVVKAAEPEQVAAPTDSASAPLPRRRRVRRAAGSTSERTSTEAVFTVGVESEAAAGSSESAGPSTAVPSQEAVVVARPVQRRRRTAGRPAGPPVDDAATASEPVGSESV
ncbi:translation initiation factor IF-2 N-terminal domain-containing protein [Hoyosella rhizosphaerae]|uniref:Ribonuclease E n=1 Tax=Hoyosella rhizosphaerae TaxID=1755582 RepID=A0A916UGT3_9ACTN|nr:translation initiation factor IF-2 N-terminal domain-containing protein [Hoyosella rhizosphaerae]MBN4928093.1 translation initiation factor IF-2 N-terminal domain-containing protein [Hoyosella rhizosphaerae]GGC72349.1 hypothetical protein GCM10011410_26720 [Hoyosella rhizosphaerae]